MTREQMILSLQQQYAARREENQRAFEQRTQEASGKCPGLAQLLEARREALMAGVRNGILAPHKTAGVNGSLSDAMAVFNQKIGLALEAGGFPADYLQPLYTCPVCRDEGYLYDPTRHMCPCFEAQLNQRMMAQLGLGEKSTHTFEGFDEGLFSTEPIDPYGVSQQQMMRTIRNICQVYADTFPDTPTRDMLFTGKSGLGKTYLLQAIAHRVAQRGVLPTYISAYHLFTTARKAYFENSPDQMSSLMSAPLLLIDDLGTEPLMANITIPQLFNLLNERQNAGLHTVISTNLDMGELQERYTERITSRLLDAKGCKTLTFIGDDIRERLGRQEAKP